MTNIVIKDLTKKYGKTVALMDLSLEIKDGEFFILLGPSGCGKTTTLLCIAGLLKPNKGEVRMGEAILSSSESRMFTRPQDRDAAMVFQDYAIYPHMTVYKNIAFPLKIRRMEKSKIESKVRDVSQRLGISKLLDRKPKQLSGGQRQRVALARAMVRDPKIFLMDEPLSNLDAKLRVYARAELKKLHEDMGTTIVYVTHDQIEAMSMGDRIAILNDGVLEQVGTPIEIYENPKESRENAIQAEVEVVEPLGRENIFHLRINDKPLIAVSITNKDLNVGEKVWISFDTNRIHIFDKISQKKIN